MLKITPADRIWKVVVSRLHLWQFQHIGLSWHYPNSPKNRKTALSPHHYWLHGGSEQKNDPLRIWFYPQ
ncbi:serine/threonine protein kinase [Klebsiella pneumoniae]|uniref:serine/threonine protein kinase n=1 Tax=Klebsiella TaxID=570 RepID=UPI0038572E0A